MTQDMTRDVKECKELPLGKLPLGNIWYLCGRKK